MTSEPTNAEALLLRAHRAVAPRVICTGDPGRALRLAQALGAGVPPMLNHARGLWGYAGAASDGEPLTVQATGVGGPSAAAVVADLVALGARRIVRVGTAGATDPALPLGAVVAAERVLAGDGTSRALGAGDVVVPDAALLAALAAGADASATLASRDVWPTRAADGSAASCAGASPAPPGGAADAPTARVHDLQSAALLAAAAAGGVHAAVVVVVACDAAGRRMADGALHAAEVRAGELALAALG